MEGFAAAPDHPDESDLAEEQPHTPAPTHPAGWASIDGVLSTWFDAPSHAAGAALFTRVTHAGSGVVPLFDVRRTGVRVRIGAAGQALTDAESTVALAVSEAAAVLGLTADPVAVQQVRVELAAADSRSVVSFWQPVLDYRTDGSELIDPLDRDPTLTVVALTQPRPLRNRIHLDVVRPGAAVTALRDTVGQDPYGSYGLTLADPEGNEVDVVPGDPLSPETSDWRTVFSAMTFYPTDSAEQAGELAALVADLADRAGVAVSVDLRPAGVTIDSGKDLWEDDGAGRAARFLELAAGIQAAAAGLGLTADPAGVRFVQLGIDAADVAAVRAFWAAALGYAVDERTHVTDLNDPRRLNPVIFFQDLDDDAARRRQRNRLRLQLWLPPTTVDSRVAAAVAAGGRVLDDFGAGIILVDPEGNELVVRSES